MDPTPEERAERNPVTILDICVAAGGIVVLAGLALEWVSGSGSSGYEGLSVLRAIMALLALAALALPVVLVSTRKSDIPVVWEGLLAPVSSILLVILFARLLFPPDGGPGAGMFVATGGMLVLTAFCWKTLSRES